MPTARTWQRHGPITANYVNGQDVLASRHQNGITGTFNAGTGALTLTRQRTVANYQAALRSVTYANSSTNPSTATRTVSFVANDGRRTSNTATRNIAVAAVNDAPVVAMTASALAYTEGKSATAIDAGLTVTDADSAQPVERHGQRSPPIRSGQDVAGLHDTERHHRQSTRRPAC